jgi:excisionase family DNA binding protein
MPGIQIEPLTLTINEAATLIGVGRSKALSLVRDGKLKAVAMDGRIRVLRPAIDEYLNSLPAYSRSRKLRPATSGSGGHSKRCVRQMRLLPCPQKTPLGNLPQHSAAERPLKEVAKSQGGSNEHPNYDQ